jgi:RNAse (barnase) inhibitor barstar
MSARWLLLNVDDDVPLGRCAALAGLFVDRPVTPRVRLLGCRPEPLLRRALAAIGQSSKAGRRRRRISAEVDAIAADGSAHRLIGAYVSGTVEAAEPSRNAAGLVDVTVECDPYEPLPSGVLDVLRQWYAGRPTEKNLWARYNRTLRHHWAGVTLGRRVSTPDRPAGLTYDLDGRFVTDIEGFYCAIGEAINGAGGYFGWNLAALDDCLRGNFGARTPFRLVWHDAAVARRHHVFGRVMDPLVSTMCEVERRG